LGKIIKEIRRNIFNCFKIIKIFMVRKIINKIRDLVLVPVNLLWRELSLPLKPRWLVFEITDACNSHCLHCSIWCTPSTPNPLTVKEIESFLSDPLFDRLERILLTGGEVTVRADLKEALLAMHKVRPKAKIWLSTNGILPDRAMEAVKFALENNIFIGIGVSLDAAGPEHDEIRGTPGNFAKADKLIRELAILKKQHPKMIELAASFTLSNLTVNYLSGFLGYTKNLDIDTTIALYEEGSFYYNQGNKLTDQEALKRAVSLIPDSHHNRILKNVLAGKKFKFKCFSLQKFFVLRCNGSVAPCLRLANISSGNVRQNSPSIIWRSVEMKKNRQMVKKCDGCLNTWAIGWSFESYNPLPLLYHSILKRIKKLKHGQSCTS
jgi:MoaA/NifB/PqqE/SkfB family radical SAM enzyme